MHKFGIVCLGFAWHTFTCLLWGNAMNKTTQQPLGKNSQSTSLGMKPIAYNQLAGNWRTEAMRSHASPRLLFITKGQGRITIAGMTHGYGPNNLIFLPAHVMYGYEAGPTVFGTMLTIPNAMSGEWPDEPVHLRLRNVQAQKQAAAMCDAMEQELNAAKQTHSRAAHYHLGLLSIFFERQMSSTQARATDERTEGSAARLVAAYTDLIERDYRNAQGVADFAASLGVTPTHLTRCCNQTCGRSALALLRDRITYEACLLLRETRTPVAQIAKDLGFRSAAYFTRSFQSKMGHTPSHFRKNGTGKSLRAV